VKKKRKKKRRRSIDEGSYVCPTCGEEIVIPLDPSGGTEQKYVEDCPVCCNPNVVHLEFFGDGESPRVWADAE
jgi:Cysteine-rich CPXCG